MVSLSKRFHWHGRAARRKPRKSHSSRGIEFSEKRPMVNKGSVKGKGYVMKAQSHRGNERKLRTANRPLLGGSEKQNNPRAPTLAFIEEIQHRADAMTPVLEGILNFRPSLHWNE